MTFHKQLYLGDSIKNPRKIKRKLKMNAGLLGVYVIALAEGSDQLEFYHAAYLKQKQLRRLWPPHVVGLAASHEEAMTVIERIVADCYAQTHGADIKKYLFEHKGGKGGR